MTDWLQRSLKAIPCGAQTYSKSYKYFTKPFFAEKGIDGFLYSVDGTQYHDYSMALGSVILGYKPASWFLADANVPDGLNFSCPHPLEVQLAEKLIDIIPSAEMVKFFKNGSDATEIAVRLARAYTGKDWVISFSYHGFHDWYVCAIERNRGVHLKYHLQCKNYQEFQSSIKSLGSVAAVILEPSHADTAEICALAVKNGILVIFDEVLTGFRYDIGGLQKIIGITPDLSCFGKCMANGLPLSAVTGKSEIMQLMDSGGVFASSTFGGETLAIAAALKTISELEKNGIKLTITGAKWWTGILKLINKHELQSVMCLDGMFARCGIKFNNCEGIAAVEWQSLYQQELLARRVLTHGINNFCVAHTDEQVDYFLEQADEVLSILSQARKQQSVNGLLSQSLQPMFRR